jgi:vacuolar iron transporter family protein
MPHTDALQRYRANWQDEIDIAAHYRAMADGEPDDAVARVYRALAAMEDKHAGFWEEQFRTAGVEPGPRRPSWRARLLAWIARRGSAQLILPTVATREYTSRNDYLHEPETAATRMTAQERPPACCKPCCGTRAARPGASWPGSKATTARWGAMRSVPRCWGPMTACAPTSAW